MKKLFMVFAALVVVNLFIGCATVASNTQKDNKINLDNFLVESDYDFIYEVINNFNVNVTVAPFIQNSQQTVVSITNDVVIAPGESYQFKFNTNTLYKTFENNIFVYCYFQPKGYDKIRDWVSALHEERYEKHTVTIVENGAGWIGEKSQEYFGPELVIYEDGNISYKVVNKTDYSVNIQGYVRAPERQALTKEIVLESGQTYDFRYKLEEVAAVCENDSFGLGFTFENPEKGWYYPESSWYWWGREEESWYNKDKLNEVKDKTLTINRNGSVTVEE